jgi:formate hydrogenlyase subunit 6/NADH:ubiquinone oxidoreductase subunit I
MEQVECTSDAGKHYWGYQNIPQYGKLVCIFCGKSEAACPSLKMKLPHEWKTVESQQLPDSREDWSVIPGDYCIHCDKRKEEK